MYNWSVDLKELRKHKEAYTIWRLQQLINYGLAGEKLNKSLVRKYWNKLYLDPKKKKYLRFLLWPKR